MIWLVFCTLPAMFIIHQITLTSLSVFCPLALLLSVQAGKLRCGNLTRLLAVVSIANVCLGISMLTVESVADFMVAQLQPFLRRADGKYGRGL